MNDTPSTGTTSPPAARTAKRVDTRTRGVWLTHKEDLTEVAPHSSEITALRQAVDGGQLATWVPFGSTLAQAAAAAKQAPK